MTISPNTKISAIIKQNPNAIDAIVSINKYFKKLKNPFLRHFLAPKVTLKEAAKIGNTSVDSLLKALENVGFNISRGELNSNDNEGISEPFKVYADKLNIIDVRETINAGFDPFSDIMTAINQLDKNHVLKVVNLFEPIPLVKVLKNKGFESFSAKISENEYHTFFKQIKEQTNLEVANNTPTDVENFKIKAIEFGENMIEIDVRLLEMPEPMSKILEALSHLPETHALFVHHKKTPQFLLPELKSRGYEYVENKISSNHTEYLIYKPS